MTWGAVASIGGSIVGGMISSKGASAAADAQSQAAAYAADLQNQQYQQNRTDQMPWMEAGKNALAKLEPLASNYTPFDMTQFKQDPGYAFRLSEGIKALDRSAASRGGLLSGATIKGAERYGQDMASQEYMNAFNRYQTERAARLQPLQSLAGVGQTTAQQLGQAGANAMNNMGENITSGAAARASGYVARANILTGALNQGLNYLSNSGMLKNLNNPQPSYDPYSGGGPMMPGE